MKKVNSKELESMLNKRRDFCGENGHSQIVLEDCVVMEGTKKSVQKRDFCRYCFRFLNYENLWLLI